MFRRAEKENRSYKERIQEQCTKKDEETYRNHFGLEGKEGKGHEREEAGEGRREYGTEKKEITTLERNKRGKEARVTTEEKGGKERKDKKRGNLKG